MSESFRRANAYIRSSASSANQSSWSEKKTYSPLAASMPTLRGLPDQPEFSWWITRMWGCRAARASSRAGVSSVEPSSTKIASYSSFGRLCRSSDSMQSSRYGPGL